MSFYVFYNNFFKLQSEKEFRLNCVRRLRNAAAHNTCMLSSLKPVPSFSFDTELCFELLSAKQSLSPSVISSSMKVPVLNDFAAMLSVYSRKVTSEKIKTKTFEELKDFFNGRMILRKEYFSGNTLVKNAAAFAVFAADYFSK